MRLRDKEVKSGVWCVNGIMSIGYGMLQPSGELFSGEFGRVWWVYSECSCNIKDGEKEVWVLSISAWISLSELGLFQTLHFVCQ